MNIEFSPSRRSTVGAEWELGLVDRRSGELSSVAERILDAVRPDGRAEHPKIKQELLLNTIEVITGVCETIAEVKADLAESLDVLHGVADPLGVEMFSAGTHPFSNWYQQKVTDKERYAKLIDRTQWWGRQMLIYGVHVHVGVDHRDKVLPILDALLNYAPHLQALSASSPYWGAEDTGYASNRALMFQQLPTAGLPFQFRKWAELESYTEDMFTTGVIDYVLGDPLGHPAGAAPGHDRDAGLRRAADAGGGRRDLGADAVPGRRLQRAPGRRRDPAVAAAVARPGEQVARGPLRHRRDRHPGRGRARTAGHRRHRRPAGPAGAGGAAPGLRRRAARRRKDPAVRAQLPAAARGRAGAQGQPQGRDGVAGRRDARRDR